MEVVGEMHVSEVPAEFHPIKVDVPLMEMFTPPPEKLQYRGTNRIDLEEIETRLPVSTIRILPLFNHSV
jgi:hypothetical protein